jgi:hypothetical protein
MKIPSAHGMYVPPFGPFGDPAVLVDLAIRAEEAGWDGVFPGSRGHRRHADRGPVDGSTKAPSREVGARRGPRQLPHAGADRHRAAPAGRGDQGTRERIRSALPLDRFGTVDEVAPTAVSWHPAATTTPARPSAANGGDVML